MGFLLEFDGADGYIDRSFRSPGAPARFPVGSGACCPRPNRCRDYPRSTVVLWLVASRSTTEAMSARKMLNMSCSLLWIGVLNDSGCTPKTIEAQRPNT